MKTTSATTSILALVLAESAMALDCWQTVDGACEDGPSACPEVLGLSASYCVTYVDETTDLAVFTCGDPSDTIAAGDFCSTLGKDDQDVCITCDEDGCNGNGDSPSGDAGLYERTCDNDVDPLGDAMEAFEDYGDMDDAFVEVEDAAESGIMCFVGEHLVSDGEEVTPAVCDMQYCGSYEDSESGQTFEIDYCVSYKYELPEEIAEELGDGYGSVSMCGTGGDGFGVAREDFCSSLDGPAAEGDCTATSSALGNALPTAEDTCDDGGINAGAVLAPSLFLAVVASATAAAAL